MQKVMKCDGTHAVKFLSNLVEKQKSYDFPVGFFQFWPKLCRARGARVFDQMTSNQVQVGPECVLYHLRAHERNLFN